VAPAITSRGAAQQESPARECREGGVKQIKSR